MLSESPDWCLIAQETCINNQYDIAKCKPGQFSLLAPHIITNKNTIQTTTPNSPPNNDVQPPALPTNDTQTANTETVKSNKRKRSKKVHNPKPLAIDEEYLALIDKDHKSFLQSELFLSHFPHSPNESPVEDGSSKEADLIEWGETMKTIQKFSNDSDEVSIIIKSKEHIIDK
jgi:hypothetical protein